MRVVKTVSFIFTFIGMIIAVLAVSHDDYMMACGVDYPLKYTAIRLVIALACVVVGVFFYLISEE